MQTAGPVAVAPAARSDLDYMAYGQPYSSAPPVAVVDTSGGAIGALRNSFAAAPGPEEDLEGRRPS